MKGLEFLFGPASESWVLAYLLNSLWQVPLVFCAALAAGRLARPAGPRMEHRVWVGALLLEAFLPFCHIQLNELWQRAWGLALWFLHGSAGNGETRVILGAGTASRMALPWHTAEVLAAIALAYVGGLLYFAGRLGWGMWITGNLLRRATPVKPGGEAADRMAWFQGVMGIGGDVICASTPLIPGPATVGAFRHTLLLPTGFLDRLLREELDAVLAHEFAHMRRADFAKNLLYGVAALPVAYHPLLWLTRRRLAETRELVCDAMAAEAIGERESYARSLLRLARMLSDGPAPRILHAIGILDANIFERRVMHLTRKNLEITGGRRLAIAAACVVVAVATCTSALALRMDVTEPSTQNPAVTGTQPKKISAKESEMNLLSKVAPVYPVEAKKAKVSGTVILTATIGKDGSVEQLKVVSGPAPLKQSAMDAVRQWKYKPFLLNGDPVEVETKITVIYSLAK